MVGDFDLQGGGLDEEVVGFWIIFIGKRYTCRE